MLRATSYRRSWRETPGTNSGWLGRLGHSVVVLKHLFHAHAERRREAECQQQRRHVLPGFQGDDGLARNLRLIGQCLLRHCHTEFLKFLKTIDRQVPKRLQIHLILDNYATHNHPSVKAWLAKHPRFQLHFTPTSASWVNMVEIFFGQLSAKAIRRGIFTSVPALIDAIETYLAAHNDNPEPFRWTANTDKILEKVRRGRVALDAITN